MFSTVVAVVALVVLVLPGFIASRVAAGRRAQPTSITDLELVLRALGYALIVHAVYLGAGWTGSLIGDLQDAGRDFDDLRWQLLAFLGVVLATAVGLGFFVGWALRKLEAHSVGRSGPSGTVATGIFHALGGQDARDAFDYVFERRRKREGAFIAILHVDPLADDRNDSGLRVGVFGPESYFGQSPRPHDLHLQEVWEFAEGGRLRRASPRHEAWYSADQIKDIWFREIEPGHLKKGEVINFARRSMAEVLGAHRRRYATQLVDRAAVLPGPVKRGQLVDALDVMRRRHDQLESSGADYSGWTAWSSDLEYAGAVAVALARQNDELMTDQALESNLRVRIEQARHSPYDWKLWLTIAGYYREQLSQGASHGDRLDLLEVAAHLAIGLMWVDDFDPADWE